MAVTERKDAGEIAGDLVLAVIARK